MAAATRADAGCVSYTFAADVEDPDRVLGIEVWADRAALDAHMRHTHTRAFRAAHRAGAGRRGAGHDLLRRRRPP